MAIDSATLAKFYYRLSAGRSDGKQIPLAFLANFRDAHGPEYLALIVRAQLKPAERKQMDFVSQQRLTNIDAFFKAEVDAACDATRGGDVFAHMAAKFQWSISMSAPANIKIPEKIGAQLSTMFEEMTGEAAPTRDAPTRVARSARGIALASSSDATATIFHNVSGDAFAAIGGPEFRRPAVYVPPACAIHATSSMGWGI
jgi:hypothetical protein